MTHKTFDEWLKEENFELWKEYYQEKYKQTLPEDDMNFYEWAEYIWIKNGTFGGGS